MRWARNRSRFTWPKTHGQNNGQRNGQKNRLFSSFWTKPATRLPRAYPPVALTIPGAIRRYHIAARTVLLRLPLPSRRTAACLPPAHANVRRCLCHRVSGGGGGGGGVWVWIGFASTTALSAAPPARDRTPLVNVTRRGMGERRRQHRQRLAPALVAGGAERGAVEEAVDALRVRGPARPWTKVLARRRRRRQQSGEGKRHVVANR